MVECSCIEGNYNFFAEALDKDTIIYQDLSDWMDEEGYKFPTEYTVEITPPLSSTSREVIIKIGQLNRLTASQLGAIKDGIYCFETDSCGVKYKRSVAIFPYLRCCTKQAWATLGIEFKEQIEDVENHLKLATINAELNNVQLASQELKIAKILLENIKCDCDC